jgi:hypothetical protein
VVKFNKDERAALWEMFEAGFLIRRSAGCWDGSTRGSANTSWMPVEAAGNPAAIGGHDPSVSPEEHRPLGPFPARPR